MTLKKEYLREEALAAKEGVFGAERSVELRPDEVLAMLDTIEHLESKNAFYKEVVENHAKAAESYINLRLRHTEVIWTLEAALTEYRQGRDNSNLILSALKELNK